MKYLTVFSVILLLVFASCETHNWSKTDQDEFLRLCFFEGGSKDYCNCFLDKMMVHSPIAEEADQIDFETKVELAKNCD